MPADLWLLLPAIVAFATAVIFAGYRLATRPTRQAERREAGEGFAALPRLLPSGLPATFDAPDRGHEASFPQPNVATRPQRGMEEIGV